MLVVTIIVIYLIGIWGFTKSLYGTDEVIHRDEIDDQQLPKEDLKNGFMIVNGNKAEALPSNLFDIPSKEREEEIIRLMVKDLNGRIKIENNDVIQ